ncbi:MAG: histidine--tRNA ligase [Gemmatimonadaceae bacterium]|nr:histidine--tRNA ligase [Gemmatimonadaceae bacterium]
MKGALPLPGFRDFYPDDLARRAHIARAWRAVARRFAFVEYDGPPLEPLELYTQKSGEEIVTQLYAFTDKGAREVSLRPEMTPTFARMVAAKANALRKPVRWFSLPQLFRYERAQKGRLREHFQLNVDIVGETSERADAELLAVALEICAELELGAADIRARVSDRRLLSAILNALGLTDAQHGVAYAVIDKVERASRESSMAKLTEAGVTAEAAEALLATVGATTVEALRARFGAHVAVVEALDRLERYLGLMDAYGYRDWVVLDLTIVRGLAYYTGIVFELFDAQGEFRAVAGGGRYDNLLQALGGVDLPALGFGMGDVVLGELLAARGKLDGVKAATPEVWLIAEERVSPAEVIRVGQALRAAGAAVEYAIGDATMNKQRKVSHTAESEHVCFLSGDPAMEGMIGYKRVAARAPLRGLPEQGEHVLELEAVLQAFRRAHGRD